MATAEFQWGDEEFDDSFFQEVDRLEELATSLTQNRHPLKPSVSSASAATVSLHPPPPTPVQLPPPPQPLISGAPFVNVSYSPPRELSQRFRLLNDSNDSNPSSSNRSSQSPVVQEQPEIERLKTELSQVSKQLSDLKQECFELRKERDKNKKLKSVCSNREASTWNSEAAILDHPKTVISHRCERAAGHVTSVNSIAKQKDIGIQTDKVDEDESAHASTSGATSTYFGNPELLSIWSSESCNRPTRNFAAKLLEMCATDFCFLFRFLSPNMTSKVEMKHLSLAAFPGDVHGLHSAGVNKISQLYSVLAQLNGDMVYVDALVEILLDLCSLENALVVRRSLHILHVAVDYLLSIDRRHPKSVLCSGIISRWRDATLSQMLFIVVILQLEKEVA
uniref:Protein-serine/threonine phosphatase n=1 Tax=Opuntia streptacantha TaxID=393608 RepID=A0A7C9ABR1_OPUST